MRSGFTEREALKLIGQSFETLEPFVGVPRRTRGVVTEALNSEDHWNVMIEWNLPGIRRSSWYSKHELETYMHRLPSETG